jgi:hypothetical protein
VPTGQLDELGPVPSASQAAAAPNQVSRFCSPTATVSGTLLARMPSGSGTNAANAGSSIGKNTASLSRMRSRSVGSSDSNHLSATSSPALAHMNTSMAWRGPPSAMACSAAARRPATSASPSGTIASSGGS